MLLKNKGADKRARAVGANLSAKGADSRAADKRPRAENFTGTVSVSALRDMMSDTDDVIFTDIAVGGGGGSIATAVFIDGMVSTDTVYDFVLRPLVEGREFARARDERDAVERVMSGRMFHGIRTFCGDNDKAVAGLLTGEALIVFDGIGAAIAFDARGFEKRGITEPTSENV
ncbi:MAG: spore germination protein, partial [Oscillospiraceae bacterium]|nr:spore germination protein [Oscillospiraceae bacterium]